MKPLLLRLAALPMVLLLMGYPFFPAYLNWAHELQQVSSLTRQIFWVHNFFIVLLLLMQALLLLGFPRLVTAPSPAGMAMAIGLLMFWGLRLILQIGYYDVAHWWGKPLETVVHVGLIGATLYMNAVFALAVRSQWRSLQAAA